MKSYIEDTDFARFDTLLCDHTLMIDNLTMLYHGLIKKNGENTEDANALYFVIQHFRENSSELRDLFNGSIVKDGE